ncbi:beta-ketoacyl synthase N-terminal-like domain-containing protein, partial [Streptomyces sp. NPDC127077]|uniref:beta-ketoacyl synthase N-terminal-like domain-containing protein n=1 Tax=Streptomyces sp. NPDC127077 TaxID=3347131 RepID=UPI003654BD2C
MTSAEGRNHGAVVTGLGALTPLGPNAADAWQALLDGRSGVRRLDEEHEDWPGDLPVRIAGTVTADPVEVLGRVQARKLDRGEQLAVAAAREAFQDAGRPPGEPETRARGVGAREGGHPRRGR